MKKLYLLLVIHFFTVIFSQNFQKKSNNFFFYENKGQIVDQNGNSNSKVKYLFNSNGLNLQIRNEGFSYDVYEVEKKQKKKSKKTHYEKTHYEQIESRRALDDYDYIQKYHRIDIDFVGANKTPEIIAEGKSEDFENYYNIPNKPEGITHVYRYQKLIYKNLYPNIDLVFFKPKDSTKTIEYNFVIHPGGKVSDIQLQTNGAPVRLKEGKLVMNLRFGEMHENIPKSWIEEGHLKTTEVLVNYSEIKKGLFGFNSPKNTYDKTLVIDPVPTRIWGSYFGGNNEEQPVDIEIDKQDNVYILGMTMSTNQIATAGTYITTSTVSYAKYFAAKFNENGNLLWSTYIYESDDLYKARSIKINSENKSFIVSEASYNKSYFHIFNPDGTLHFKKYFSDIQYSLVEICKDNSYYLIGKTNQENYGTSDAFQATKQGLYSDPFIRKFDKNHNIIWGTYFNQYNGIQMNILECFIDENDNISILGENTNKNMPLRNEFQAKPQLTTMRTGFYCRFASQNGQLLQSSYVGIGNHDFLTSGKIIDNKLILFGKFDVGFNLFRDGIYFIDLLSNTIIDKKYYNYAGYAVDVINVVFDKQGNFYMAGSTILEFHSNIVTPNAYKTSGLHDSFIVKHDKYGNKIWGTLVGGESSEEHGFLALDSKNFLYILGSSRSETGISTSGVHQQTLSGSYFRDVYINKFADCSSQVSVYNNSPICPNSELKLFAEGGTSYTWTGPNGFTSSEQNPIIPNANISHAGVYTCIVSGSGECDGTFTTEVKVEDKTAPVPDLAVLPDIVGDCKTIVSTFPTATDQCKTDKIVATTTSPLQYQLPGNYLITWKFDDANGNSATQTQKVIIKSQELPVANSSQVFCSLENPKISNIRILGQNVKFYDASGNVLNNNQNLYNGIRYFATQTINGCESEKIPILITINTTPKPISATIQEFCTSRNAQIKDLIITGTDLRFYDNAGNVLNTTDVLRNNYSYFVTQKINNCESLPTEIKVALTPNAVPANDYEVVFCNDATVDYTLEDITKYESYLISNPTSYQFEYYDQNSVQINDSRNRKLSVGQNIFNVKIKTLDGCWKMVKLAIQLNPKPIINLPEKLEFCRGLSVSIDAGAGFKTYEWYKDNNPSIISTSRMIRVSEAGNYTVKVTNDFNCTNSSTTYIKQSVLANIIKVEVTNNNAKVVLSASGEFLYSLDNINWQKNNEFTNLSNGNHKVFVTTKLGCISGEMNFSIFNIFNAFSPDGDGVNDTWKISGLENYPDSEINIYDRFGNIVFKTKTNRNFEWNGMSNGRVLPTGTYWYSIKISDGRVLQGYLVIKNRN